MIMMVVTVKVAVEPLGGAVKTVMTVSMILLHMDLSAVIQPGVNMVLIVLHWKATITGIAQAVIVLVTVVVLMAALMVVVAVMLAILMTALVMVIAVQSHGLVMALLTVKIRPMAVT